MNNWKNDATGVTDYLSSDNPPTTLNETHIEYLQIRLQRAEEKNRELEEFYKKEVAENKKLREDIFKYKIALHNLARRID